MERHGNTKKLSCTFILSSSSASVFFGTVYYFAVAPTPASRYTREFTASTRPVARVLIARHMRVNPSLHMMHVICTVALPQVSHWCGPLQVTRSHPSRALPQVSHWCGPLQVTRSHPRRALPQVSHWCGPLQVTRSHPSRALPQVSHWCGPLQVTRSHPSRALPQVSHWCGPLQVTRSHPSIALPQVSLLWEWVAASWGNTAG